MVNGSGKQRPKKPEQPAARRVSGPRAADELARRHALLLSTSGAVGWQWEVEQDRVHFEGDPGALLGVSPDWAATSVHDLVDLVHPDDRVLFQASLKQALVRGRGPYTSAFRIVRPDDGRILFVEDRGEVTWGNDYSSLKVTGFLFEIRPAA